jgi:hypothetical protein
MAYCKCPGNAPFSIPLKSKASENSWGSTPKAKYDKHWVGSTMAFQEHGHLGSQRNLQVRYNNLQRAWAETARVRILMTSRIHLWLIRALSKIIISLRTSIPRESKIIRYITSSGWYIHALTSHAEFWSSYFTETYLQNVDSSES